MHLEEPHQRHACVHHSPHIRYHNSAHRNEHPHHHAHRIHSQPTVVPPKFVIPHFRPHFRPLYMSDNYNTRQRRSLNLRQRQRTVSGPPQSQMKPHWIPAPARSQPIIDVPKTKSGFRPRPTFPMCLVCDKQWHDNDPFNDEQDHAHASQEEDIETLTKRFEANTKIVKEQNQELLNTKYEDQRRKVMQRLWNWEHEDPTKSLTKWQDILKNPPCRVDTLDAPLHPGYQSSKSKKKDKRHRKTTNGEKKEKKKDKSKAVEETGWKKKIKDRKKRTDKNLTESLHCKEVNKDSLADQIRRKSTSSHKADDDSTDISQSFEDCDSHKMKLTPKAKKKHKKDDHNKVENDYFIEVIIDELKKENRELKFSLLSRDEQLNKAAEKIHEMIEENAQLAKRLEQALEKATRHATGYDAEIKAREEAYRIKIDHLEAKVDELEKTDLLRQNRGLDEATTVVNALKKQLADCEEEKESLITYIENLKISYQTAFCKD